MSDIIKKGVLDSFSNAELPLETILFTLGVAFIAGLIIYLVYWVTFRGVVFNKSFGASLIMICMVTSMIILPLLSNLLLSIGMVGALSIVRFRTAVKEMIDTIYMFWAIGIGIALGAQQLATATVATFGIGLVLVILSFFKSRKNMPFILVLRFEESVKKEVQKALSRMPQGRLKSKVVSQGTMELTIEMNVREDEVGMIDAFSAIPGVHDASLISYKGDIVS